MKADRRQLRASVWTASMMLLALGARVTAQDSAPERVPADCGRSCLESLVDDYLTAVIAHDPSRLPLSGDVLYTENKQRVGIGDGFWRSATGRGRYSHYFADTVMSQAGWMGTMHEGDTPVCSSTLSTLRT